MGNLIDRIVIKWTMTGGQGEYKYDPIFAFVVWPLWPLWLATNRDQNHFYMIALGGGAGEGGGPIAVFAISLEVYTKGMMI